MAQAVFSSSWYRVKALKPRLRTHARIHRHEYRGDAWYVLQLLTSERYFRFTPAAYSVIGLMDGKTSVDDVWQRACERLGDDAPTQDELIQILSQLYQADALQCDVPADAAELLQRREDHDRRRRMTQLTSVFSWKMSLFDPDRFLTFLLPLVRPLFGWLGALLWLGVVIPAAVLFASHWKDFSVGVLDRVFLPENIVILWFIFPLIKAFHEFGHAFAVKAFGGEVHDMGLMLLVFTPVPYVDASSSSTFREKSRRLLVGSAGVLTEVFLASLAFFLWLNAQPGFVRSVAYNAVFIAGVSTILFNANPLLRYDGYYVLADLLEIPNLRTRATAYLVYLCERYLYGQIDAEPPISTSSERVWFVLYGVLSSIYRLIVVIVILLYVADQLFQLGALIAIAAAVLWFVYPVLKGGYFLFTSPRIRPVRSRAITVTAALVAAVSGFIFLVPMPYRSAAEGVTWMPEEAIVRAGTEGFVEDLMVKSGSAVTNGQALVRLSNPLVKAQEESLVARIRELDARRMQYLSADPVQAEITGRQLQEARDQLSRVREELAALIVRSRTDGTLVVPVAEDLPGRFVRKGVLIGYVVDLDQVTVRAVVSQARIDMVRREAASVQVRLSERLSDILPATVKRIVPGASEALPAPALGAAGGGQVPIDPSDDRGVKAVERVFQVDLEIPMRSDLVNLGGRAYVRFDHGWAPLGTQWYFELRQLFLSRFDV
jgi:putative peptide zinc metalloprotease protein